MTGAISKIRQTDVRDIPANSVEQLLQGTAAGVQVNAGSGKLGQAMQIRVRGNSSVSASNEPLYVVDGIQLPQQIYLPLVTVQPIHWLI